MKQSPLETGTMTGELHMARNGAGFLVDPETNEATWIEREDLGTALVGDTVTIKLKVRCSKFDVRGSRFGARGPRRDDGKNGPEGRIIRIEKRAPRSIVGTVVALGRFTRVQPLSPTYRQEFIVPGAKGANVGDRVVMRFVRWENPRLAPEGEVTDVIGPADDPSLDTISVMKQYDLPEEFPPHVIAEAERVGVIPPSDNPPNSKSSNRTIAQSHNRTIAQSNNPNNRTIHQSIPRLDLRKKFIFTCDPESARDYDDALSIETDKAGNRVLGVHIADVSYFVTPGSALDKEAHRRSTSVYLVDKVVPMLPEQLSNGVCSLVPNEDRYAFSAFLTFDAKGNCIARKFAKSVIRSKARFTYEQVMAELQAAGVVAGRDGAPSPSAGARFGRDGVPSPSAGARFGRDGAPSPSAGARFGRDGAPSPSAGARFGRDGAPSPSASARGGKRMKPMARKTILAVHALAQQLRKARFAAGALDMEVPEAEIKIDEKGMMTGIEVRPYDESHQMIEECMVAANEAVAKELWTRGVKILARLHEPPDAEKLEDLRGNLAKLGISCGDLSNQKNLAKFLKKIKGSPLEGVLSVMVLRSMKRALYSAKEIGHFGLAKKFYAHFTSPIRRYPDLVLHRQLASWIAGKGGRLDLGWLNGTALHCSEREQNADDAERSLDEIKKYRYLQQLLAESSHPTPNTQHPTPNCFDAVISKCTRYGVFVDLPDLAVGGMVHVSKLSDAYVRWNDFNETLEGGGKTWSVGAKLKVRVVNVDFDRRLIDFEPVVAVGRGRGGKRRTR